MALVAVGCGAEPEPEPIECPAVSSADFDATSGWGDAGYCDAPTELGCFPYHESSEDTCGPFVSMRTTATSEAAVSECESVLEIVNCGTYADDAGTSLSFYVEDAANLAVRVVGTYAGSDVDTTWYFNPCQGGCLSAITLETLSADQQKICEIPRTGKPVCLFPETAHTVTIARVDAASMELRMAGVSVALSRD